MTPSLQNCLGFGIIRCIDNQTASILTPLSQEIVQRVNLIIRSSGMDVPVSFMVGGYEHSRIQIPYCTFMAPEGVGAVATRKRPIARKRFQK